MTGMVLSTDDYFMKNMMYDYNPDKLTEAHQWNRERGRWSNVLLDKDNGFLGVGGATRKLCYSRKNIL